MKPPVQPMKEKHVSKNLNSHFRTMRKTSAGSWLVKEDSASEKRSAKLCRLTIADVQISERK